MKRNFAISVAFMTVFAFASTTAANNSWMHHGTKKEVTVYVKDVSGSNIPMVKAVTEIDASTHDVWSYITDPQTNSRGLKQKVLLGQCGSSCEYVYVRFGHFLIDDRHYVIKIVNSEKSKNGSTAYSRSWAKTNEKSTLPHQAIEVEKISGRWILEPLERGTRTRLTYTNHLDMGGNLTGSFIRNGFIKSAYSILITLRDGV